MLVKEEMNGLHETAIDYFKHCHHVQFSTCEENIDMLNSHDHIENDLQCVVDKEVEKVKSRIQHLCDIVNKFAV
jgi:hypothetical protein